MRTRVALVVLGLALGGCGTTQLPTTQPPTTQLPTTQPPTTQAALPTPTAQPTQAAVATAPITDTTSLAVPAAAIDLKVADGYSGKEVTYLIDWELAAVIAFYNQQLAPLGMQIDCGLEDPDANFYSCSQSQQGISVFLNLERKSATQTKVTIELGNLNRPAPAAQPGGLHEVWPRPTEERGGGATRGHQSAVSLPSSGPIDMNPIL